MTPLTGDVHVHDAEYALKIASSKGFDAHVQPQGVKVLKLEKTARFSVWSIAEEALNIEGTAINQITLG
jgi:hypothetical protein